MLLSTVSPEDKVEVRLSDGSNPAQGRLEVGLRGMWGYVCDTLWDSKDADVVCRQLGYRRALVSISGQRWGKRLAGFIFTGNVRCHGGETNIDDCQHGNWGYGGSGCSYSRIVNVVCDGKCACLCMHADINVCVCVCVCVCVPTCMYICVYILYRH